MICRLCRPSSELHIAEHLFEQTALADLLGIDANRINENRLYRGLDKILPYKEELEEHLKDITGSLFDLNYDLFLYDVTSTYFEGEALGNPLAQRGYSRDHRGDCKQVCIGFVVTKEGFPLGYEVFAGNRTDVTTVEEIVEVMENRYGKANRIWVMDRGMASSDNFEFLKEKGRRYIVGANRGELKHYEAELLKKDWQAVQTGLEVKRVESPDGQEVFILCRSSDRAKKERAIHDHFEQRIEEGLIRMASGCERRRYQAKVLKFVWEEFTAWGRHDQWKHGLERVEMLDARHFVQHIKMGVMDLSVHIEVVKLEPPHYFELKSSGPVEGFYQAGLSHEDGVTTVSITAPFTLHNLPNLT